MATEYSFKVIRKAVLLVAATLFIGVSGYMLIEGYTLLEAIYMTILTMSTVGYMEVKPLSDIGRIFTIGLIISSLAVFAYFISLISRYVLDGEFIHHYRKYKMQQKINELTDHVIVCGFGRNGQEAATVLANNGINVVVIEEKHANIETKDERLLVIEGDSTKDEVLIQCNIGKAKALITTLPIDADNVYVALAARELNPTINIISRASTDSSLKKLKTAGVNNIIMPDKLGGAHMATLVLSPDIKELLDIMSIKNNDEFSIKEFVLTRELLLGDMKIKTNTGATVLAYKNKKGHYILNPDLEITCKQGEKIIAMGNAKQLVELQKVINS